MCRTVNLYDINGLGQQKTGRGNICPVTIILPTLAMIAKNGEPDFEGDTEVKQFLRLLEVKIDQAKDTLIERYEYICSQSSKAASFMWENNLMAGYIPEEGIRSALKHGTLTIGQLGLAECLQILIGKDHTTKEGMELAKKIEQLFKDKCADFKKEWHYTEQKPTDIDIRNKMKELAEIKLNRKLTPEEINEINQFKN